MATQRIARIVETEHLNSETKLLHLALPDGELLNFSGGQYIILNTNIQLAGGKIAKRAYSILSSDAVQTGFQICVKKVGDGPGSNYMHGTSIGSDLPFSGPWGQFIVDDFISRDSVLVLATDTGITAALGLVQSAKFKAGVRNCRIVWFVESSDYFIPQSFVRNRAAHNGTNLQVTLIPSLNHADRLSAALKSFKSALDNFQAESAFLSGDGSLLYPFQEELLSRGIKQEQVKLECFFNNPYKKAGIKR